MTSEQYQALLQGLAHVAVLPDPAALLNVGLLNIGEYRAVLVHEPGYDPNLLQVRLILGGFPAELKEVVTQKLLEMNYIAGYGGEWVYSLMPESGEAVLSARIHLDSNLSAQELWQVLSDCARHGGEMWDGMLAESEGGGNGVAPGLDFAAAQRA
jgi:hypothetical protein